MADRTEPPATVGEYIKTFPPPVRTILRKIRATIAAAAPDAQEIISYRMPAFAQHGVLIYFAAFKAHIGVFPPVSGDARLENALAPYRGPTRNLRFPFDRPMPYDLIRRIVRLRVRQNLAKAAATYRTKRAASKTSSRGARKVRHVPRRRLTRKAL